MTAVDSRTLTASDIQQLARRLYQDERDARAGAPLSDEYPAMTVADAYSVQLDYVSARTAAGAHVSLGRPTESSMARRTAKVTGALR